MKQEPAPFPWQLAMSIAFGRLGISPKNFWAMTPRELAAALEPICGGVPGATLTQPGLAELMARYPD